MAGVQRDGLHYVPPLADRSGELAAEGRLRRSRPGDAPYNVARYIVFRKFAEEIDPGTNRELMEATTKVAHLVTTMSPDRAAAEAAAKRAASLADKLLGEVRQAQYDQARTRRLLKSISGEGDAIAKQGERAAEQATMSVDSLYIASAKAGAANPGTRAAIDGLFGADQESVGIQWAGVCGADEEGRSDAAVGGGLVLE